MLAVSVVFSFAACGSSSSGGAQQSSAQGIIERPANVSAEEGGQSGGGIGAQVNSGSNILIAYFTSPETDGVDTVASASRVATENGVLGSTEFIASEIQKNIGGDLFKIETVQKYPGTHSELLDFAYNEKSSDARPELASRIEDINAYDYIFVGYPNWNADLPMPMYTFFDEYDLSGKTIIPFVTHGGSGFSNTINTIKKLEPGATVVEAGLSVSRNSASNAQSDVKAWTDSLIG